MKYSWGFEDFRGYRYVGRGAEDFEELDKWVVESTLHNVTTMYVRLQQFAFMLIANFLRVHIPYFLKLVGGTGFEPATPGFGGRFYGQSKCIIT